MLEPGRLTLNAEEYHADRSAVSKSWLDRIDRSPAHLKAYLDGYRPDTPAMLLGRLVHVAVLEPDLLADLFVRPPEGINRRTNAGRAEYAEWQESVAGRTLVSIDQWIQALAIRDSVQQNRAAKALLTTGDPEQTVVWKNLETGELCKARADWLRENVIVDVKTTQDARPAAFAKSIANYRYDVQTSHYSEGFDLDRFVFIAVEKEPPYACAVYAADEIIRARGKRARDRNLQTYAECRVTGTWPGYEEVIHTIELPRWALNGE